VRSKRARQNGTDDASNGCTEGRFAMQLASVAAVSGITWCIAASALAQLQPAPQVGPRSEAEVAASEFTTRAVEAEAADEHESALAQAQVAIRANPNGEWGYYNRGVALLALGRVDDAISSFLAAERRCRADDPWARSVAIWGEANALSEARPCRDATASYERYAGFVADLAPEAATMALAASKRSCVSQVAASDSQVDPAWAYYRRGDELVMSRRFDEAVASYREAELRLPESESWGKSIAIWGQANALKEAGRCAEAAPIYERYAEFVEARDPEAAALGRRYAKKQCVPVRAHAP
jgi:tetratricopeptide (TPR) repeat protein